MKRLITLMMATLVVIPTAWSQPRRTGENLSHEARARELVKQMTLEEKVSQMQNRSAAIERLGIPEYEWWSEALHGIARAGLATVFPQVIGLAASFDEELVEEIFTATSDEARAKHRDFLSRGSRKRYEGLSVWTPNINLFRDPRWGRGQETYGEDPYLTSRLGLAVVRGLQGDPDAPFDKLHACAKHYAVHSGPEWNRHSFDAHNISQRDLRESYLPAFEALVREGGVKEVMGAYNRFEGVPCNASHYLLDEVLRKEWGFDGVVVSDCGAIRDFFLEGHHETHADAAEAAAAAVKAGCDLECGSSYKALVEAVERGLIREEEIDRSVVRLLKARFEMGHFEPEEPFGIPYSVVDCEEHRALAKRAAEESFVLLQNRNDLLPLDREARVALVGPNADNEVMQWGNYNGTPSYTITLREGLEALLPATHLIYDPLCGYTEGPDDISNFLSKIEGVEVVIFAGGIWPKLEGEEMRVKAPGFRGGDRETIELPEAQRRTIEMLHRAGKRVVLVHFSGSAMALEPESRYCEAILQAWYPGQEGGSALADMLYGKAAPSGKLPVTFYRSTEQLPNFEDYRMAGHTYRYFVGEPLYPFGHGLSYGRVDYGELKANTRHLKSEGKVRLSVKLKSRSDRTLSEVVQLYIARPADCEGPQQTLRAFRRVVLEGGKSCKTIFELTVDDFAWFNPATNRMESLPGEYEVRVGNSSDPKHQQRLTIELK